MAIPLDPINEEAGLGPNWVPLDGPPIIPGQTIAAPPASDSIPTNPKYIQGTIAPNFQHDVNFVDTEEKSHHVPKYDLMPLSLQNAISSAQIQGTTVKVIEGSGVLFETNGVVNPKQSELNLISGANISLTSDSNGGVAIAASGGDDLTHGDPVWEYDSAYVILRDEFANLFNSTFLSANQNQQVGELGWDTSTAGANPQTTNGIPPYIGNFSFENQSTQGLGSPYVINATTLSATATVQKCWALLENPGWKLTFVFKVDTTVNGTTRLFTSAKKAIYVGLIGPFMSNLSGAGNFGNRPDVFIGVRYDTSATPGSLTLSAAAAASGGNTVYTGTITGGDNGAYNGLTFTVTGFVNGANNGTFVCVASSATTLTLNNASGVAETHAGTASATGLNDTKWTFEAVTNRSYSGTACRHNLQGQTFVTTMTPTQGAWLRLEITCAAVGVVKLSLTDGTQTTSTTFTVPKITVDVGAAGTAQVQSTGGAKNSARITYAVTGGSASVLDTSSNPPFVPGSVVSLAGFGGNAVALNGQTPELVPTDSGFNTDSRFNTTLGTFIPVSGHGNVTGYPAYQPAFIFGNDDTASPAGTSMRFFMDYFSFVWNPNLGPNAPGTPNSVKPRYW